MTELSQHEILIIAARDLFELESWGTRTDACDKISVALGEPDENGYYTPTFTIDYGDNPLKEAERRASMVEALLSLARRDLGLAMMREAALPSRLHDLYGAALCVSDLPMHDWEECDHKIRWERDADRALGRWGE